jgi:hypothetical protein
MENSHQFRIRNYKQIFLVMMMMICSSVFAQNKAAMLKGEIEGTESDTGKARLSGLLAHELVRSNPSDAVYYADLEISLSIPDQNYKQIADGFCTKASAFFRQERIKDGLHAADSAMKYARLAQDSYYQYYCNAIVAEMFREHEYYNHAFSLYKKAFAIVQQRNDTAALAILNRELAETNQASGGNVLITQDYYRAALENTLTLEDWQSAAINSIRLVQTYIQNGDTAEALAELERSGDLMNKDKKDALQYASNCLILADAYLKLDWMEEAQRRALTSIRIIERMERKDSLLRPLLATAEIYLHSDNVFAAEKYADRLYTEAKEQQALPFLRDVFKLYSEISTYNQQTTEALDFYKKYKLYSDTVTQIEHARAISKLKQKFLAAKGELQSSYVKEIEALQNDFAKKIKKGRRNFLISVISGAVIILTLLGIYFFRTRKSRVGESKGMNLNK